MGDRSATAPAEPGPLAILAGGGAFPRLVAETVRAEGGEVIVAAIRGEADASLEAFPHRWVGRGQLGAVLRLFSDAGASRLVIVGGIRERRLPRLSEIDLGALWVLLTHLRILRHGDDGLLRRIARIFEARGLTIVGAAEIAPGLLAPEGPLGARRPDPQALDDIAVGVTAARDLGARDLGQGVIVVDGRIAAEEGRAGTDALLAAHAAGRDPKAPRRGVLVKCAKPQQDLRLDMPAIGPATVEAAARAGLAGIAVEAGATLVADRAALAAAADAAGLFVYGVTGGRSGEGAR